MAKVYEALQRAEEERRRKATGEDAPVALPVQWDPSPATAPRAPRQNWLARLIARARAEVPAVDTASDLNKRRFSMLQPESYVAEQFRSLRGRIDSLASQRPIKTIAITSANAGEGKSTAAINLATVTAMSVGRKVLLMDCDLRRPKIHRSLGLQPKAGLAEILLSQCSFDDAVLKVEGINLDVLAVRNPPSNPSELLASAEMRRLLEEVSRRYDRVILDTPATLGLPDSKTVSELCDGLVMVVRADVTPREDVQVALEILDKRRVLGLLLNGSDMSRQQYGYY